MSQVPVGILSTAHPHASAYADAIRRIEGAALVGIASPEGDEGAVDGPSVSPEELLEEAAAVVVCSTNVAHRKWVERAASNGTDVLCEKPAGTSVEETVALVDACLDAGVRLGVAMPLRFSEPVRQAKATVESGNIGDIQMIAGTNLLQQPGADWFFAPEEAGGGAVMDHTVHIVDLVRWITGQEVQEVYAETPTRFHDEDVEDVDVLSMELEDGTPFIHDGSWSQPDNWDFWGDAKLRLVGTDGVVDVDCFDQTLKVTRDEGEPSGIESVYWGTDINEELLRDFVGAVRDGRPLAVTGRDAIREVAVVEAAYESARRGVPTDVGYPAFD